MKPRLLNASPATLICLQRERPCLSRLHVNLDLDFPLLFKVYKYFSAVEILFQQAPHGIAANPLQILSAAWLLFPEEEDY